MRRECRTGFALGPKLDKAKNEALKLRNAKGGRLTIAELYVGWELWEMLDLETEEQVHCRRRERAV